MGQVFDRPTRLRGLATRAIALGRRTDVYVGCAPRTRRHGGRDAVERAFVLWADCDGEDAVAALRRLRAGAVDRDRLGHRQQLPRLLAAHRAARRATRSSARTAASRTRSAPTPRRRTPRGSSGSPARSRTSTSRRRAVDALRLDADRRVERGRRRRVAARPAGAGRASRRSCRPSIAAMTRCWRSRRTSTCGGCSASRSRATARCRARSTTTGMQACMSTRPPSAAGTASARCRRGGTIYDLAAPLYGYTRPRRGLPPAARRAAPPLRTRGRVMTDEPVSHDFVYVHTDIPAGMTIREWRAQRAAERAARRALRRMRARPAAGRRALAQARLDRLWSAAWMRAVTRSAHQPDARRGGRAASGGARSCPPAIARRARGAVKPCPAGRFASPDGPGLDGPARRAQARP